MHIPRGGWRYGAGRPGRRAKAELSLALDVRALQRAGKLRQGYADTLTWRNSPSGDLAGRVRMSAACDSIQLDYMVDGKRWGQSIVVVRTLCHFGGSRPWLICPSCSGRVAVLYARGECFGCRYCHRVAYQCQSENVMSRINRKQRKIEAKMGSRWRRPKGMHKASYERLLDAVYRCESEWEAAMGNALKRGA
jgi:hypothetical protein